MRSTELEYKEVELTLIALDRNLLLITNIEDTGFAVKLIFCLDDGRTGIAYIFVGRYQAIYPENGTIRFHLNVGNHPQACPWRRSLEDPN